VTVLVPSLRSRLFASVTVQAFPLEASSSHA
jgi:hypothetical protein